MAPPGSVPVSTPSRVRTCPSMSWSLMMARLTERRRWRKATDSPSSAIQRTKEYPRPATVVYKVPSRSSWPTATTIAHRLWTGRSEYFLRGTIIPSPQSSVEWSRSIIRSPSRSATSYFAIRSFPRRTHSLTTRVFGTDSLVSSVPQSFPRLTPFPCTP